MSKQINPSAPAEKRFDCQAKSLEFGFQSDGTNIIKMLHPMGIQGAVLPLKQYNKTKEAILAAISKEESISLQTLIFQVTQKSTPEELEREIWSVINVKLDLEARGMIECVLDQLRLNIAPAV